MDHAETVWKLQYGDPKSFRIRREAGSSAVSISIRELDERIYGPDRTDSHSSLVQAINIPLRRSPIATSSIEAVDLHLRNPELLLLLLNHTLLLRADHVQHTNQTLAPHIQSTCYLAPLRLAEDTVCAAVNQERLGGL